MPRCFLPMHNKHMKPAADSLRDPGRKEWRYLVPVTWTARNELGKELVRRLQARVLNFKRTEENIKTCDMCLALEV